MAIARITFGARLGLALGLAQHALVVVENASNESVENTRDHQRKYVEQNNVCEEVALVVLAIQCELARVHLVGYAYVVDLVHFGQEQPRSTVGGGEHPHVQYDPLGPSHRAQLVRLHGMTNGYVPFHGERRYRQ